MYIFLCATTHIHASLKIELNKNTNFYMQIKTQMDILFLPKKLDKISLCSKLKTQVMFETQLPKDIRGNVCNF